MTGDRPWLPALFSMSAALLVGCGEPTDAGVTEAEPESPEDGESGIEDPEAHRAAQQRTDPREHDLSPGTALARRVWAEAGGEQLHQVAQLDFQFVVREGEETLFAATHRWDRREERDHVRWTDSDGHVNEAIVSVKEATGCGNVDGEAVDGEALASLVEAAHGRWVNDSYWLMVPLKILDPGVHQGLKACEGGPSQLELEFDDVGLTPGDRYLLDIEDDRITAWEYRGAGEAQGRYASFESYTEVGPLTLALDHRMGERGVFLTDVAAHDEVQPADFTDVVGCEP